MTKKNVLVTGLTFLMVGLMTVCAWAVPQLLNYQGKLTDAVGDPLDGTYSITFKLYNVEIDGSSIWDEPQSVTVTDGFYSVQLGAATSFPAGIFENDELYLEVVISGETLEPRQRLTSTAFAMKADTLDGMDSTQFAGDTHGHSYSEITVEGPIVLSGSFVNAGIMSSTNTNATGGYGGYFEATGSYGHGVHGIASNTAGNVTTRNYGGYFAAHGIFGGGVLGKAVGIKGTGVKGEATSTDDYTNVGGEFIAKGTTGIGVRGVAESSANKTNYGGYFGALGRTGIGVYGSATDTRDQTNYGGYFLAKGSMGRGVYGESPGISGVGVEGFAPHTEADINYGGLFEARGKNARGVYGIASNGSTGPNYGGYFVAKADRGVAVYGLASSTSERDYGNFGGMFDAYGASSRAVLASSYGKNGVGVWGRAVSEEGKTYGVFGEVQSAEGYGGYFKGRGYFSGKVGIGTTSPATKLEVIGTTRTTSLEITGGADLAEPCEVADIKTVKPGMVVSFDSERPGQLRIADRAYDRTVAGIVSGANGINPGLTMGQEGTVADGSIPVALTGRVYAWADASNGSIEPGDLLTTSNIAGHTMKVTDHEKAQGAVLGKAMTGLKEGKGLVLVLVALQ